MAEYSYKKKIQEAKLLTILTQIKKIFLILAKEATENMGTNIGMCAQNGKRHL